MAQTHSLADKVKLLCGEVSGYESGVDTYISDFISQGIKFVCGLVPDSALRNTNALQTKTMESSNNNPLSIIDKRVVNVTRNGIHCPDVSGEDLSDAIDSTSLTYAVSKYPVFYMNGSWLYISPNTVTTTGEGIVYYIGKLDYATLSSALQKDLLGDLDPAIVYFAAAMEMMYRANERGDSWVDVNPPVAPESPDFGGNLTISASPPPAPTIASTDMDLSSVTFPTFTSPVFTAPTLTATIPTYTSPVLSVDLTNVTTHLAAEDIELAGSEIQKENLKINEYTTRQRDATQVFNGEAEAFKDNFQEFQSLYTNGLSEFTQRMANETAVFNKEVKLYDAQLQKAVNDARASNEATARDLQLYQQKVSLYTQDINKEVQDFTNTLTKEQQEYSQKLSKFNAELQKYTGEVNQQIQSYGHEMKRATLFMQSADKFYNWSVNIINGVVQRMSPRTKAGASPPDQTASAPSQRTRAY